MEKCGCGKETVNDSLEICRKCVTHNIELHDTQALVEHWLCTSMILDPENIRRVFHKERMPTQNAAIDNAICSKCGYSKLASKVKGIYCSLGKFKPIKYCRHFFNPSEF